MKRRMMIAAALMMLFCAGALADARPIKKYTPGQMIDVGFEARFMAGCEFEDGTYFMLVDSDFNDGYLQTNLRWFNNDSISGGLPVPDGASAQVAAQDEQHCTVTVKTGKETWTYEFVYEPTEQGEESWVLKRYRIDRADGTAFAAELSLYRMDLTQSANGRTETEVVYFEFFRQAYNLNHAKHPASIEAARVLEKQYPVAVVSPEDPSSRVNLRKGPSTKYERCGSLYSGALLAIREVKDGWAKIFVGDTDAYISADFLTFGKAIANVPDMRPTATVRDGETVEVSRAPYRGGGGTVTWTRGGQQIRIMGEYNSQWRIACANPGSYYIHVDDLK